MKQSTVLGILKTGKSIFLTGSAGTGKTYILNQYIEYLKERKIQPAIVAPTGIAASHLNGSTIHSFFGLGIREDVDEYFLDSLLQRKYLHERLSKLKVLVIDEVSMISLEMFASMDKILKAFKFSHQPFGGVQVIVSGDFFQLPPVTKERREKRFAWQAPVWKDLELRTCYLEKNFRQDEDEIVKVLDDIRSGEISEGSYDILQSSHKKELEDSFRPTKLYTHNIDVDRINNAELEMLEGGLKVFGHTHSGVAKNVEKIFKSSLVQKEVALKIGTIVLFIKNNYEKGYINGTTGTVVDFDENDGWPIVEIFSGRKIKAEPDEWNMENDNGAIVATVRQVPLRLAWAITIHKSQGMTLDTAEIDLSKTFEAGQGYVALSRVRSIKGLRLMGINDMALRVDPLILHINDYMKKASIRAEDELEQMSSHQKKKLEEESLEAMGGILKPQEIKKERKRLELAKQQEKENLKNGDMYFQEESKKTGWEKTAELLENTQNLKTIAEERGVTIETVLDHLISIRDHNPEISLEKFKPEDEVVDMVEEAVRDLLEEKKKKNFLENGTLKLKPIFDMLDEEVSYVDIKLARIFIKE